MSKGKLLAIVVVWLMVFGIGAVAWRFLVRPHNEAVEADKARERLNVGSSDSRYKYRIDLALDSFSGYALLRSRDFRDELAKRSIKITLHDDGADYQKRLEALRGGKVQMGVFTIDALLKTSSQLGDLPASIVAIVDETRGADAMVGYKSAFQGIDDLNRADVRFVLTPDSPSETLSRVVMSHFALDRLAENPVIPAKDAEDVYKRYRASTPETPHVFVLWEPYVSKVIENPNTHVIVDSARFRGYIVDVLVVSRDYLAKNRDLVKDVVECYYRAAYQHRSDMIDLVLADARSLGQSLSPSQAKNLVEGVWWKNTQENFAHFGLMENTSLQHIEDIISNISDVLVSTSAISADPTGGRPNLLYYDQLLRELKEEDFHPGAVAEGIRDDTIRLRALSDAEWESLTPVGTLNVPTLVFARGTAKLLERSRHVLDDLAQTLETSQYYVLIRGNATRQGDLEANKRLAATRAQAAAEYLASRGIAEARIRSVGVEPSGETSVTFMLGQLPY